MKRIIITLYILPLLIHLGFAVNRTGKNLAVGYGYVAGVKNINAVTVNPANLDLLNCSEVMVSFNKPFIFHSFLVGIPLIYNKIVGLAFINNNNFKQYCLGMNVFNINILKFGLTTGMDREISSGEKDKWGFVLSPGLRLEIINIKKKNFNIDLGLNYKNLYAVNDFKSYKDLTRDNIDFGMRSELFIESLFLDVGLNYYLEETDYTGSLEYSLLKPLKFIIMTGKDSYGFGSEYAINVHEIGFAYVCDKEMKSFNYSLSYKARVGKLGKHIEKKPIYKKRPREKILEMQKELLDKGLKLYRQKRYKQAREVWRRLNRMDRTTEYAKRARQYIIKVNNILKSIGEE